MKRFAAVLFFFIAFLYNGYARADAAAAVCWKRRRAACSMP